MDEEFHLEQVTRYQSEIAKLGGQIMEMKQWITKLEFAVRQHRDERGDDRCHADDGRLYRVLPEGDTRPVRETLVTLENCMKYIDCRQSGRDYISPQRRIEELEQTVVAYRTELGRERDRIWKIIDLVFTDTPLISDEKVDSTCFDRVRLRTIMLGLLYPDMNLRQAAT